jgi:preprotein translocase subunit SecG
MPKHREWYIGGHQEGLFKLVTLDRILNRITGVTSGCWWLVVVNAITYIRYLSNKPTKHMQLQCYK